MEEEKEFYVFEVRRYKSKYAMSGRCGEAWIRVGDSFNVVFCYDHILKRNFSVHKSAKVNVRRINIVVASIIWHLEFITELAPGHTALLEITGTGIEALGKYKFDVVSNLLEDDFEDENKMT